VRRWWVGVDRAWDVKFISLFVCCTEADARILLFDAPVYMSH